MMDNTNYSQDITAQYCFPDDNASCIKVVRTGPGYIFLYIFLSCVSVSTVCLNLLVIISISHFKQLHTPTNLLILSLAVADLLVGLVVMPVKIMELIDSCWYSGNVACSVFLFIIFLPGTTSLCSLVFIAVDRFIAVSDPLRYSIRVTVSKALLMIILGWSLCSLYISLYLFFNDHLLPPQVPTRCHGECVVSVQYSWVMIDLVLFFLAPSSVILVLYSVIFKVARSQAKAVGALMNQASQKLRSKVSSSSETKAAKTLGIVVFVYLGCWIPYYLSSLIVDNLTSSSEVWTVLTWLIFLNSTVNPLIYAIFYPWFRESVRLIVTCRIFAPNLDSADLHLSGQAAQLTLSNH